MASTQITRINSVSGITVDIEDDRGGNASGYVINIFPHEGNNKRITFNTDSLSDAEELSMLIMEIE